MPENNDLRNAIASIDEITKSLDACMDELKKIKKTIEATDQSLHPENWHFPEEDFAESDKENGDE